MKKKSVYFIYIVPKLSKRHSITIEYPKKKENKNEILWGIEYNDLKSKRPLIKNLNVINLELNKNEEIKFKFKFTIQNKIILNLKNFSFLKNHVHYLFIIYLLNLQDIFIKIFLNK